MLKRVLLGTLDVTTLLYVHILKQHLLQQLSAVGFQHTRECQPKCQIPLCESGCNLKEQCASSKAHAIPVGRRAKKGCKTLILTERTSRNLIMARLFQQSGICILKEKKNGNSITSYQHAETSKCDLNAVLKELRLELCLMSVGKTFHCLALSIEKLCEIICSGKWDS